MVQALAGIALLQLRQVEPGAEMLAFAVDDGGAHAGRQVLEGVAQRGDQAVGQRVALGGARQTNDGDFLLLAREFERNVLTGLGHGVSLGAIMVINDN